MRAIQSSASIPGVFPPVNIGSMTLVDGGTFTGLDLGEAILRCREMVDSEEDIIVDAVIIPSSP